ncbi:MAG: PorT family protein [Bacteroidales bacterium]|nr:PorT family protein [Bacteroidales bacterium]
MKKYLLATALLLLPMPAILAQTFGVKAGLNFPRMLVKDDDETYSDNVKAKLGFHLGGVVEVPLTDALSIEGSVIMSLKGGKFVEEFGDFKYTRSGDLIYISIPVAARYTYDLGDIKLYGLAGPYMAVGISGKYKDKLEYNGDEETNTESVDWGNDSETDDLKRPDAGLFLGAGVRLGNIQAGLWYELGLLNISPYTDNGFKTLNRSFGITAAYFFGNE